MFTSELSVFTCFWSAVTFLLSALNCARVGLFVARADFAPAGPAAANARIAVAATKTMILFTCPPMVVVPGGVACPFVALMKLPEPYDFELSTERFRSFGPDLANLWDGEALLRAVGGREVRIAPAPGGVDVEPLDAETEPVVRKLLGEELVAVGFSRRKAEYTLALARSDLELDGLGRLPEEEIRARLTALPGIGEWTVDWFLARHLAWPRAWPAGDLALRKAVSLLYRHGEAMTTPEVRAFGARFDPFQNLSAHYLLTGMRTAAA